MFEPPKGCKSDEALADLTIGMDFHGVESTGRED